MKEIGTLRQLIREVLDLDGPYDGSLLKPTLEYLCKKDKECIGQDKVDLSSTTSAYVYVIDELLSLPLIPPGKMPLLVSYCVDDLVEKGKEPEQFIDVCLLNTNYESPPEGLKPWGCRKDETPPAGCYNVNDEKYNKYFAFGLSYWSEIIDVPIFDETGLKSYEILAEILWELTFYGWTQKEVDDKMEEIKDRCDKAMKEIESGNFVELSELSEDNFGVKIPNSVLDQLKKGLE